MDQVDLEYAVGLARLDPAALGRALVEVSLALARRPGTVLARTAELALGQAAVALDSLRLVLGETHDPVAAPPPSDRRFADRAWRENPFLRATVGGYVVSARTARRLLADADVPDDVRRKASLVLEAALDALAPSNVPWLNPRTLKELYDTGGLSARRGVTNLVDDLLHNQGRPRQFDPGGLEVGRTLAATPGRVVYRNDLIELIAYEPQTETVFEQPVLYSPAWINKYYLLDLAPGRSFIEHAVRSGLTVFAISYRNPDDSAAGLRLDDYLRDGVLTALDQASALTGSKRVNLVGVCIGGTLAAIVLAVLAARGRADAVGWATISVGLLDFADPGGAGAFTDAAALARMERRISRRGFFSGDEIASPFNLMRTNEFFWNYVVANWYMGRRPEPFDILAWNDDKVRLPGRMHADFLRACYLENRLVRPGALTVDGTPIDLRRVQTPLYVQGSETDHIAPWRSVYRTTQVLGGRRRFVLASGGHIAGIVSPVTSPKAAYRVSSRCPPDPDAWFVGARRVDGSWWTDWVAWAGARSGRQVAPPALPAGPPAPGTYVRG
ncbi:MAG: PHA/PHB synthase family protein [Gaiellaceae bacterium]